MLEFSELESDDEEPSSRPTSKQRRPQDKTQGYPRSECFRVEKNLLVYGSVTVSPSESLQCELNCWDFMMFTNIVFNPDKAIDYI